MTNPHCFHCSPVTKSFFKNGGEFRLSLNAKAKRRLEDLLAVYAGGPPSDDRDEHLAAMQSLFVEIAFHRPSDDPACDDKQFAEAAFEVLKENFRRHVEKFGLDAPAWAPPQNRQANRTAKQANRKGRKPQLVGK